MECSDELALRLSALAEAIHVAPLSFTLPPHYPRGEVSLVGVGSSHVLLAALTKSATPEIVILLWDVRYSVVLASQTTTIPSSLHHSKDNPLHMEFVRATAAQYLLLLSPANTAASAEKGTRSSILVVPATAPAKSTIANAMGRASLTAKWLVKDSTTLSKSRQSDEEKSQHKLLDTMRKSVEKNTPTTASTAFFEWEGKRHAEWKQRHLDDSDSVSLICTDKSKSRLLTFEKRPPLLDSNFVKKLVNIALPHQVSQPLLADVLNHLLKTKTVTRNMLEGGVIPALVTRKEWVCTADFDVSRC